MMLASRHTTIDYVIHRRCGCCPSQGKVYDAMDNRAKSVAAYRRALQLDCYCYEAFEHLTQHHLLSAAEQEELMQQVL